jgi:hypothetical protein
VIRCRRTKKQSHDESSISEGQPTVYGQQSRCIPDQENILFSSALGKQTRNSHRPATLYNSARFSPYFHQPRPCNADVPLTSRQVHTLAGQLFSFTGLYARAAVVLRRRNEWICGLAL